MANEFPAIPPSMRKICRRLNRWQSAHTGRLPIPERLWIAAAEQRCKHGIYPTAKALHQEYGKLKQRAEAVDPGVKTGAAERRTVRTTTPLLIEVPNPSSTTRHSHPANFTPVLNRFAVENSLFTRKHAPHY